LNEFVETIQRKEMGKRLDDLRVDVQVGPYRLIGRLTNIHEKGMLRYRYGNCKGRDLLHGYICSRLLSKCSGGPQEVHVVTRDNQIIFQADEHTGPTLENMIDIYLKGWKKPIDLFVEPGWQYFQQQLRTRSKISPIEKARQFFRDQIEEKEPGQPLREPEWALLYDGAESKTVIGDQFVQFYDEVLDGIFSLSRDMSNG